MLIDVDSFVIHEFERGLFKIQLLEPGDWYNMQLAGGDAVQTNDAVDGTA